MKNHYPDTAKWFEKHIATKNVFKSNNGTEFIQIEWKEPGTSHYYISYNLINNNLIVTGDLFDAIYHWSSPVSFESISSMNLDYFSSKCEASPKGRDFLSWNNKYAYENFFFILDSELEEFLLEKNKIEKSFEDLNENEKQELMESYLEKYDCFDDVQSIVESQESWVEFLKEYGDDALGSDCWEYYNMAMMPDMLCHAHLEGLKLAVKQLLEKGTVK